MTSFARHATTARYRLLVMVLLASVMGCGVPEPGFIDAPTSAIRRVVVNSRRIVSSLSPSTRIAFSYRRQSSLGSARAGRAGGSPRRTGRELGGGGGRSSSVGSSGGSWPGAL